MSDVKARRKFRIERLIGRYLANPLIRLLPKIGVHTNMATELETTGRKSGRPRIVPVAVAFDDEGGWLISQHGRRSGWAVNVSSDPKVRIRQGKRWRQATAAFVPEDDVIARSKTFASSPVFAPLTAATFRAMQSDPISVRITFTDTGQPSGAHDA